MTAMAAPATTLAAEGRVTAALVRELAPRFTGKFSSDEVSGYIGRAITDLRGSVSAEALPEMAARLAYHRLTIAARLR